MATTILETILAKLTVSDESSTVFEKVAKSAQSLNERVKGIHGSLMELTGIAGAVGGALTLKGAIESTQEYIKKVKEVSELTGTAAHQTDFLFSAARQGGVEYSQMEQIMFRLSRRGAAMESTMATMNGKTVPGMMKKFKHLGVDITKGPVASLEAMAKGVQSGKIDASDLMQQFQIPMGAVNDFKGFLEALDSKALKNSGKNGLLLSKSDIDIFSETEGILHVISDSFMRIKLVIGREILPVFRELVDDFSARLPKYLDMAQKFGRFLADHMEAAVHAGQTLLKVMAALKALDVAKSLPGIGKGMEVVSDRFKQSIMAGMAFEGKGPAAAVIGALKASLTTLGPVIAGVAVVAGFLYMGLEGLKKNLGGTGEKVSWLGKIISARFELMGEALQPIVDGLTSIFGGDGTLTGFIQLMGAVAIEKVVGGFEFFVHVLHTSISFIQELGSELSRLWREHLSIPAQQVFHNIKSNIAFMLEGIMRAFQAVWSWLGPQLKVMGLNANGDAAIANIAATLKDLGKTVFAPQIGLVNNIMKHWDATSVAAIGRVRRNEARLAAAQDTADSKRQGPPVYDFRGSRFDITQSFEEGFDPDRIAVSFADDLAKLGEMRAQSGFAPLYSVR